MVLHEDLQGAERVHLFVDGVIDEGVAMRIEEVVEAVDA